MNKVVLMLEDEPWLGELYQKALENSGFTVLRTDKAQSALDLLDDRPDISIVLVDLLLPEHNGLNFLYEVVSHDDLHSRRYVLMSSLAPSEVIDDPAMLDFLNVSDYLYKPEINPLHLGDQLFKQLA